MRARLEAAVRWGQGLPKAAGRWLARLPAPPGGLGLWITLLSLGFLLAALQGHGRQMLELRLDLQGWLWMVLGVGFSLLSLVANGLGQGVVLRWLGLRPRWAQLALVYLDTNLRKFLPGGIWHLTSRVRLFSTAAGPLEQPASLPVAVAATLLDPLLAAIAALALVPFDGWQSGLALLCLLPLALLWPRWLRPLLQSLERRQTRRLAAAIDGPELALPPPDRAASLALQALPRHYPWLPLLALLGFVLLRFAGFACCVLAFDLQGTLGLSGWLAGFALAWTAGLVVPGAPGGLGVFEAVLLLRLGSQVPEAPLLAIAISYRLMVTLADLLAALTARLDLVLERPRVPTP
ncbi:lysylphosphatidylglycerol synthase domain-containing protein [Aphanothece stagnina]|uniref:lysylphosphatidylglycerol synthase domain-containing protein n=3 Tax=Aphanothece TaxID=1121 RepID=UPI00398E6A22